MTLPSPRLYHCRCQQCKIATFRPLTALLSESTAPELLFMETKWASLVSYGMTVEALKDFLPVDAKLDVKTVRNLRSRSLSAVGRNWGKSSGSLSTAVKRTGTAYPSPMAPGRY